MVVVGIENLEYWQQLKVHKMPLKRYLRKIELFKKKVESAIGIQLKTLLYELISESWLKKQQKFDNKQGSAIIIIVSNKSKSKKLYVSGLRFDGVVKIIKKYWKSRPSSVCITCCRIGYKQIGKCKDQVSKYVICAGPYKIEDYQYGVTSCNKKAGKVSVYITMQYANCGNSHSANSN